MSTGKLKIFIVNDENAMLVCLEMTLRQYFNNDVEILTFDEPERAWENLLETQPHLLILDDVMPILQGIEIIWRLADWEIAYPVIMTTGFERPELLMCVQDCTSRGLNIKLLNVPFDVETFVKAVEDSLNIQRDIVKPVQTPQAAALPLDSRHPTMQLPSVTPAHAAVKLAKNQPVIEAQAHPIASVIGEIASSLRPFKDNPRQTVHGVVSLWKMARGFSLGETDAEIKAAKDAAFALMFENLMMDNAVVWQLNVTSSMGETPTLKVKGIKTLQTFILLGNPHCDFFKMADTLGIPMPKEAVNVAMEYHRKIVEQKYARPQTPESKQPEKHTSIRLYLLKTLPNWTKWCISFGFSCIVFFLLQPPEPNYVALYSPEQPVWVSSYTRSDGTSVSGYYRALPGQREKANEINGPRITLNHQIKEKNQERLLIAIVVALVALYITRLALTVE